LRHLYKEVTDLLRDNVSEVSQTKNEVVINTPSDFSNKDILTSLVGYHVILSTVVVVLRLIVHVLVGQRLTIRTVLDTLRLLLITTLRNNVCSVFLIAMVVSKQIILLSINDGFHDSTSVVTLLRKNTNYNIH